MEMCLGLCDRLERRDYPHLVAKKKKKLFDIGCARALKKGLEKRALGLWAELCSLSICMLDAPKADRTERTQGLKGKGAQGARSPRPNAKNGPTDVEWSI